MDALNIQLDDDDFSTTESHAPRRGITFLTSSLRNQLLGMSFRFLEISVTENSV